MTALEYMEREFQKHKLNYERESARGVPEKMLADIRAKIGCYEAAVKALREVGGGLMRKIKDIMDVKHDVKERYIEIKVHNGNILLCDRYSGEAVKIGEVKKDGDGNG